MPSEEHNRMVDRAILWLQQQKFVSVMVETKIVVEGHYVGVTAPRGAYPRGATLTPDAIGYSDSRKVVVECGSVVQLDRLHIFKSLGYEVYIWPYDAEEPYIWSEDMGLCRYCGRKFNHIGRVL